MPQQTPRFLERQRLGQFWTPTALANLLARQLPTNAALALDLAAGDGVLLQAMKVRAKGCKLLGADIDPASPARGNRRKPPVTITLGDGRKVPLPARGRRTGAMCAVANPPFGDVAADALGKRLIARAFPDVDSEFGAKRLELQFLARYLEWARAVDGMVSILLPCGFADGDIYRKYRISLMTRYGLRRVIEIAPSSFPSTEARCALLVIDGGMRATDQVEICRYDATTMRTELVFKGLVAPGERLDARYHLSKRLVRSDTPTLKEIGVEIERGTYSNSEARRLRVAAVHTTHLATAAGGRISLGRLPPGADELVVAATGDILLSRTGKRVSYRPAIVSRGCAPITDHVFRIRAPKRVREVVQQSFRDPLFEAWLGYVSKGVCATVLTKRELLEMPAFALA